MGSNEGRSGRMVGECSHGDAELDQLLLKCISITKYKLHFFKVIQILFSITLAMTGKIQNTFLESN